MDVNDYPSLFMGRSLKIGETHWKPICSWKHEVFNDPLHMPPKRCTIQAAANLRGRRPTWDLRNPRSWDMGPKHKAAYISLLWCNIYIYIYVTLIVITTTAPQTIAHPKNDMDMGREGTTTHWCWLCKWLLCWGLLSWFSVWVDWDQWWWVVCAHRLRFESLWIEYPCFIYL